MTTPAKEVPQAELSLKYMAWNVKQIDVNIKRIADSLDQLVDAVKRASADSPAFKQGEIPF